MTRSNRSLTQAMIDHMHRLCHFETDESLKIGNTEVVYYHQQKTAGGAVWSSCLASQSLTALAKAVGLRLLHSSMGISLTARAVHLGQPVSVSMASLLEVVTLVHCQKGSDALSTVRLVSAVSARATSVAS